jgi:inhibitor of cysteine peptidase
LAKIYWERDESDPIADFSLWLGRELQNCRGLPVESAYIDMHMKCYVLEKIKTPILCALALLLCWIHAGCKSKGGPHPVLTIERKDNNTQVALTVGQEMQVALPENPTTGFRWQMQARGEPILQLLDDTFDPPSPGIGKGGTRRWRFRAAQKGSAAIEMAYRRAWEQDQSPTETFRLAVRVEP